MTEHRTPPPGPAPHVRLGPGDAFWVVTEPTAESTLPDICLQTDLRGLALQVAGDLDLGAVTIHTGREEAEEDARNRLLVWRLARQIRIDRRLAEGEVVRVTLHGQDGQVLYRGNVR